VVCSASLRIIFSKRKTGKKKADNQGGQERKPKGNGIMEGTFREKPFMP
jgi:hypothetical protein